MGIGTFEGRAAARRFLEDWRSSFDEVCWTLEEVVDLGNGVVLAVTHQDALLADGGARLQEMWVYVLSALRGSPATGVSRSSPPLRGDREPPAPDFQR
jgi:ketosteroid isomerase-like protein